MQFKQTWWGTDHKWLYIPLRGVKLLTSFGCNKCNCLGGDVVWTLISMVLAHKPVKHQHSQELKNSKARAVPRNPADVIKQMLSLETAQFAHSFDRECWEFQGGFSVPSRSRKTFKSSWKRLKELRIERFPNVIRIMNGKWKLKLLTKVDFRQFRTILLPGK